MPTEKPRFTMTFDEELLKRIDDYRFGNRFPSRSEALMEIIRRGLESIEAEQKQSEKNNG